MPVVRPLLTTLSDFGHPQGSLKGIISAAYSLGAILSLPLVPIVNDRWGRRGSIFAGSVVMVIGAIIQGLSQNGTFEALHQH
jgi:MFS family permease